MLKVNTHEAKTHLSRLLERSGQEGQQRGPVADPRGVGGDWPDAE